MKLLLWGDGHISARRPGKRTDADYFGVVCNKVKELLQLAKVHNCAAVLQAGDMWDSPDVGHGTVSTIMRILLDANVRVAGVWGQHDVSGHSVSTLYRSPLAELDAARVWELLTADPLQLSGTPNVDVYGASFGEEVPVVKNPDAFNVLVTHRMIGSAPLWPGHAITPPRGFMRAHPEFALTLCGDYHYRFIEEYQGRLMVNCGCMMRKTIDERDMYQRPAVVIFHVDTRVAEVIELASAPDPETVFDDSIVETSDNARLLSFIEKMKERQDKTSTGWKHLLLDVFAARKTDERVRNIITECIMENENVINT